MDRLSDLTAHQRSADLIEYNLQQRQAAMAIALIQHQFGGSMVDDPQLLDFWLSGRKLPPTVQHLVKAAVAAVDTSSGLAPSRAMLNAFLGAVDRASVLMQIGAIKVPSTMAVGAAATASASAFWIGEAVAKPLSALAFASLALTPRKCAGQVAVSNELLKLASADVLSLVERGVVSAVATAIDTALLDPANAGTTNVKPPSLTNGLSAITPAGDFQNQVGQVFAAVSGGAASRPVLVVSLQSALRLTGLRDLEAAGIRVVVTPAAGANLIAIDADAIVYTDDGGELRVGEPTIEMADDPATPTTASTVMTSTFQKDLKVIKGERWVSWAKRANGVAYLTLA